MKKVGKRMLLIAVSALMILLLPGTVYANAAEPPALVVLVDSPPYDLSITLLCNGSETKAVVSRAAWEGYYSFYYADIQSRNDEYTLLVSSRGESFEYSLGGLMRRYNNIFTLDVDNHRLMLGTHPFRDVLLVSIRVLLTLLLEGGVFWLFGFRQKRSWLIFLILNLITQGALNIWLSCNASLVSGYLIYALIFGEVFVFAAEMIAFPALIREYKKRRSVVCAFIANAASFIAGGYIISILPV